MSDVAAPPAGNDRSGTVAVAGAIGGEQADPSLCDLGNLARRIQNDRPLLKKLAPHLSDIRDGLALWAALQKKSGLVGRVVMGPLKGGADKYIAFDGLDDVDGLLNAFLDAIEENSASENSVYHPMSIGVLNDTAERVYSAVFWEHANDDPETCQCDAEDDHDAVLAKTNAIKSYLSLELPSPPSWLAAQLEKDWAKYVRALRAIGPTLDGAICRSDLRVEIDRDGDEAKIYSEDRLIVALDEPLSAKVIEDTEWEVDGVDGEALGGKRGLARSTVWFHPFAWSAFDLIDLSEICGERGYSAANLPAGSKTDFLQKMKLWLECGENPALYKRAAPTREQTQTEFLVPGVIPKGAVTVLAARSGAGKSALMLNLILLAAIHPDQRDNELPFLGVPASEIGHGTTVLATAEETHEELTRRRSLMRVGAPGRASSTIMAPYRGASIDDVIADLDGTPNLALVVVDSMRKLCDGDLDRSEVVTPWMDKLQVFAERNGCAVVVIHHLNKGSGRRPGGLIDDVQGSGAVTSNARVVLTMRHRPGGMVSVKVELSKLADVKERELGPFIRDEETWTLAKAGAQAGQKLVQRTESNSLVVSTLKAVVGAGERVTRTGRRELYELKRPELAGLSRAKVRNEVNEAILSGYVRLDDDGSIAMSSAA